MTRSELEQLIRRAFQGTDYPGDDDLVHDEAGYDPGVYDLESSRIRNSFLGKRWPQVTRQQLVEMPQSISFLTPRAFVYYLPAIMLATLRFDPETGYLRENFIGMLTPQQRDQPVLLKIAGALSAEQKRVIAEYMSFVTQEVYGGHPVGEGQIALERYWNSFF